MKLKEKRIKMRNSKKQKKLGMERDLKLIEEQHVKCAIRYF